MDFLLKWDGYGILREVELFCIIFRMIKDKNLERRYKFNISKFVWITLF